MFKKKKEAGGGNFKLRAIKVYASRESLFDNSKKYRRVYDELECSYTYCEVSFYNKLFDEADWQTSIRLICYKLEGGSELCNLHKELNIAKDQNVVFVREGWGTPQPGWWTKGSYKWRVFIGDEQVGETVFYIVNGGLVTGDENPYFEVLDIRLYESPKEGLLPGDRRYLTAFGYNATRFVSVEMTLRNLKTEWQNFPLELQFNVYNDAGKHKAYMEYFAEITDQRPTLVINAGYGAETPDFWFKDKYTVEVNFMDELIAIVPFEVGEAEVESDGLLGYELAHSKTDPADSRPHRQPAAAAPTFEAASAALESLIGLNAVKNQLKDFAIYLQFLQIRREKGFDEPQRLNLHSVFTGNPGTGKTTVAGLLGKIYQSLQLLTKGHVHVVSRVDLVGEYIGQTAPKVKKAIEASRGGILFIDEAYSLTDRGDDKKDFGKEVIEVLLQEMSDGAGDWAVVCAGYPEEMQQFMLSNPGLASRFRQTFHFPDYTPEELLSISHYAAKQRGIVLDEAATSFLYKKLLDAYRNRNEHFGNARYVNAIMEETKQYMALRLMRAGGQVVQQYDAEVLSTVKKEDIERAFTRNTTGIVRLPIDEGLLEDALTQLNSLIGLQKVKKEVDELVKLARYYHQIGKDLHKTLTMHAVFKGNPGTGKTTVARLMVQIYKALGILERGHLVECDRSSLVAGYVGQTAIKTDETIQKALGGGLFIDEAYSLATAASNENDFGREAIETLLKRMEDHRGKFMVIVAGYTEEMKRFIQANPGLLSRFDKDFHFEDYDQDELLRIAQRMFEHDGYALSPQAADFLLHYAKRLANAKQLHFGNARTIGKIVRHAIRHQNLRMASLAPELRPTDMLHLVQIEDLQTFDPLELGIERRAIGFGMGRMAGTTED